MNHKFNHGLADEEMFMFDGAFSPWSLLSETEESTLFSISGYVTFKEGITVVEPVDPSQNYSFDISKSRLNWLHSPPELFELSYGLYC